MKSKIVAATGSTKVDRGARKQLFEGAAAKAMQELVKECEAIWAKVDKNDSASMLKGQEKIDKLRTPESVRQRMVDARVEARKIWRAQIEQKAGQ